MRAPPSRTCRDGPDSSGVSSASQGIARVRRRPENRRHDGAAAAAAVAGHDAENRSLAVHAASGHTTGTAINSIPPSLSAYCLLLTSWIGLRTPSALRATGRHGVRRATEKVERWSLTRTRLPNQRLPDRQNTAIVPNVTRAGCARTATVAATSCAVPGEPPPCRADRPHDCGAVIARVSSRWSSKARAAARRSISRSRTTPYPMYSDQNRALPPANQNRALVDRWLCRK